MDSTEYLPNHVYEVFGPDPWDVIDQCLTVNISGADSCEHLPTKLDRIQELQICIDQVLQNKTYISPKLQETEFLTSKPEIIQRLTATEIKILKQLAKNLSSAEIADILFISKRTVEKHRSNIIKKLEIQGKQNALFAWLKDNATLFENL